MSDAYRDDLEAALTRASDLEREVEALRKRVAELESGDRQTIEARENARRLEAALEREREELRQQHQWEVDDAHWRQASREEAKAAHAANAALKIATSTSPEPRRELTFEPELIVPGICFVGGGIAALIGAAMRSEPLGGIAAVLLLFGVVAVVSLRQSK